MRNTLALIAVCICACATAARANYYAGAHLYSYSNLGYFTSHGNDIPGVIGQEDSMSQSGGNELRARSVLDTGTLQASYSINNYAGDIYYIDADAQTEFEDNFLVTGGTSGDVVDVVLSYALSGTLSIQPQNSSSSNAYGSASVRARLFGGNVDYIHPRWLNTSLYLQYVNNQLEINQDTYINDTPAPLVAGVDYTVSGSSVAVHTSFNITAQMTSGEWQNVISELSIGGSVANSHSDPLLQCLTTGDFWNTGIVGVALSPGFEAYTLTRESPEPTAMGLLMLAALALRRR